MQPLELGSGGLGALLPPLPKGAKAPADEAAKAPSVAIALFQILVRVSWLEGLRELAVTRTTFAYDASAAAQVLGSEEQQAAAAESRQPPPAEEGGDEEEEEP